jgi:lysozyme
MKASTNLLTFLRNKEAEILEAYQDIAGVWTIGVGTTRYPDGSPVKRGDKITKQRSEELLRHDVSKFEAGVKQGLGTTQVTQAQFDALLSFHYNTGSLLSSNLLKKVKANPNDKTLISIERVGNAAVQDWMKKRGKGEINTIYLEFMKWVYITDPKTKKKVISNGLQNRRYAEWLLYQS